MEIDLKEKLEKQVLLTFKSYFYNLQKSVDVAKLSNSSFENEHIPKALSLCVSRVLQLLGEMYTWEAMKDYSESWKRKYKVPPVPKVRRRR